MERQFKYDIMPEIKTRWSPRAFSSEKIAKEDLYAVLEAASFAPSCFNEQPWRFVVADTEEELSKLRGLLTPANQVWANKAPVLILIVAKIDFDLTGQANFWHMFDTGTAWGFLSLEAERRGLITHGMAGFNRNKSKELYDLTDKYEPIAVIALGKYGDKSDLSEDLQKREKPDVRLELSQLILNKQE